jgi:hypothetical protein
MLKMTEAFMVNAVRISNPTMFSSSRKSADAQSSIFIYKRSNWISVAFPGVT